jgi:hypothetical protein
MRFFMLLAALVVVLMNGAADAAKGKYSIIGVGTESCGTWTAARRDRRARLNEQWILGFLSGIGWGGEFFHVHPLNGMDAEGVWAWMDNYCQVHPLDGIDKAGLIFGGKSARGPLIEESIFIGVGTGSCGTWTAARRDRRALLYEQWILGFLSGEGAASAVLADGRDNPLNGMDAEGVWAWIDTYCQVHPLDQISRGGQKLGQKLG